MEANAPAQPAGPSALGRLVIDLGPLVVFFVTSAFAPVIKEERPFYATGAFMVAMIVALIYSQLRYKKVSPLLLFSGLLVVVFGGITIWLHEEWVIKMKPTFYYLTVAGLLGFGLATGRNLLKVVLGSVYPGLSERGWTLLTRNFAIFFLVMAVANEAIWRSTDFEFWAASKIWLFLPATFVFALLNVPMLMRHGLNIDPAKDEPPAPPTQ